MPLFSIIVPVYNVERYIKTCLDSIIAQSFSDFEVIIVDDCSPDNSIKIAETLVGTDSRFIITHHTQNRGVVAARNTGIEKAIGQYIVFVDPDDWIEQNFLFLLNTCIAENKRPDLIFFGMYLHFNKKTTESRINVDERLYYGVNLLQLKANILCFSSKTHQRTIAPSVCLKAFKRTLIKLYASQIPEEITYAEDVACSFACILNSSSIFAYNQCLYHYRVNPGSTTMKYIPSYLKMVLWIYPFLSAQTKTNRQIDISRAIAENIAHSAAWAVCNEMLSTKPTKQIKEFIETEICENELIQQSLDGAKGFHPGFPRLITRTAG